MKLNTITKGMNGQQIMDDWFNNIQIQLKGGKTKMDIAEYTKATGTFLKADDVSAKPNIPFVITDEAGMVPNEKFGGERLHIPGELAKEQKTFDCSKTNARVITEILGTDTKKWIGAVLELETYRTKTSDGKMVDAINVVKVTPNTPDSVPVEKIN